MTPTRQEQWFAAWRDSDLEALRELAFWEWQKCRHGKLTFLGPLGSAKGRTNIGGWPRCDLCADARAREVCDHTTPRSLSFGGIAGDNWHCRCSASFKFPVGTTWDEYEALEATRRAAK